MKKQGNAAQEMVRLNGAAFRLGGEAVREGRMAQLLEETLAQVFAGSGGTNPTGCVEFNCNLYAPQ